MTLNSDAVNNLVVIEPGHHCQKYFSTLTEQMCNILDCLPEMQASVSADSIAALLYIAGYLTVKNKNRNLDDIHFYYEKYGGFTADLNRVGLPIPGYFVCQWVIYSYPMFHDVVDHSCRNCLCKILKTILNLYDLKIEKTYLPRLTKILFNNYCDLYFLKCFQESRQIN